MHLDKFFWGFFLTNFIYLLGLTQGALVITVVLRLGTARWSASFFRLASSVALFFAPLMIIGLLVAVAGDSTYNLAKESHHPWNTFSWFVGRHFVTLLVFYGAAVAFLRLTIAKKPILPLAAAMLMAFVLNETFVSWDMGMLLNRHFADAIYAPFFIVGSIFSGIALLTLLMAGAKKYLGSELFGKEHFKYMGQLLLAFSLLWVYFWFSQFLVIWYGHMPEETEPVYLRIFEPHWGKFFVLTMALIWVAPFLLLVFKKIRESVKAISIISAGVLAGIWFDRYLIVMPTMTEHGKVPSVLYDLASIILAAGLLAALAFFYAKLVLNRPAVLSVTEEVTGWQ